MEDFIMSPLEIPFYQDDPFPLQDTIFQYLQHPASSSNSVFTSVLPSLETDLPVFTEAATTTTTTPAAATTTTTTDAATITTTTVAAASTTTTDADTITTTAAAAATTTTTKGAATTTTTNKKGKRVRKPSKVRDNDTSAKPKSDRNERKAFHKEVERGRRNEMAKLYASLKKLLPVEYIKEKSALPDHIHQATNYIKHKEKTIRELEMKRNKLKTQLGVDMNGVQNGQVLARTFSFTITFTVESCSDGSIVILMKSDLADDWFPLSRVLNMLLKEGLAVLSCSYTKLSQKLHCTILTDVGAGGLEINDADLFLLREKLGAKVAEWKSSSSRSS